MKKIITLCLFVLLGLNLSAQKSDSINKNFTGWSVYGVLGIYDASSLDIISPKLNSAQFTKGLFFEYDHSKNGKSLGFGGGVFDHFRWINLPGNGDDSVVQHTVFPMYLSLKYFSKVFFLETNLGFQAGTRGENTLASPYFSVGLGTVPYYLPKKIPITLRLKYQYANLNLASGENWGYGSIVFGLGFYIK